MIKTSKSLRERILVESTYWYVCFTLGAIDVAMVIQYDAMFAELGNPRGNENPFLLTMGIMWFRYHNYIADQLAVDNPTWGDETLFNEARKWTIAVHQVCPQIKFAKIDFLFQRQ